MEHLEPYGRRSGDRPFLASVYDNWQDDTGYMWLLQAVPDLTIYQKISDFGSIPSFEDVFYPVADHLPLDVLRERLAYVLRRCVAGGLKQGHSDEVLYHLGTLDEAGQESEIQRLSLEYAEQFYQEVAAYRADPG